MNTTTYAKCPDCEGFLRDTSGMHAASAIFTCNCPGNALAMADVYLEWDERGALSPKGYLLIVRRDEDASDVAHVAQNGGQA